MCSWSSNETKDPSQNGPQVKSNQESITKLIKSMKIQIDHLVDEITVNWVNFGKTNPIETIHNFDCGDVLAKLKKFSDKFAGKFTSISEKLMKEDRNNREYFEPNGYCDKLMQIPSFESDDLAQQSNVKKCNKDILCLRKDTEAVPDSVMDNMNVSDSQLLKAIIEIENNSEIDKNSNIVFVNNESVEIKRELIDAFNENDGGIVVYETNLEIDSGKQSSENEAGSGGKNDKSKSIVKMRDKTIKNIKEFVSASKSCKVTEENKQIENLVVKKNIPEKNKPLEENITKTSDKVKRQLSSEIKKTNELKRPVNIDKEITKIIRRSSSENKITIKTKSDETEISKRGHDTQDKIETNKKQDDKNINIQGHDTHDKIETDKKQVDKKTTRRISVDEYGKRNVSQSFGDIASETIEKCTQTNPTEEKPTEYTHSKEKSTETDKENNRNKENTPDNKNVELKLQIGNEMRTYKYVNGISKPLKEFIAAYSKYENPVESESLPENCVEQNTISNCLETSQTTTTLEEIQKLSGSQKEQNSKSVEENYVTISIKPIEQPKTIPQQKAKAQIKTEPTDEPQSSILSQSSTSPQVKIKSEEPESPKNLPKPEISKEVLKERAIFIEIKEQLKSPIVTYSTLDVPIKTEKTDYDNISLISGETQILSEKPMVVDENSNDSSATIPFNYDDIRKQNESELVGRDYERQRILEDFDEDVTKYYNLSQDTIVSSGAYH